MLHATPGRLLAKGYNPLQSLFPEKKGSNGGKRARQPGHVLRVFFHSPPDDDDEAPSRAESGSLTDGKIVCWNFFPPQDDDEGENVVRHITQLFSRTFLFVHKQHPRAVLRRVVRNKV